MGKYLTLVMRGWKLRAAEKREDIFQLGGDFLLDGTGKILFAQMSKSPVDRPGVDEILSAENETLATDARVAALQRPDPWDVADNLLELGIAVAGVLGGVYGAKAAAALKAMSELSTAWYWPSVRVTEMSTTSKPSGPRFR